MNSLLPRPILGEQQDKPVGLEHGVHNGPQGPVGWGWGGWFEFSVDLDVMQSPGPAFGPVMKRENEASERVVSRQKPEGKRSGGQAF